MANELEESYRYEQVLVELQNYLDEELSLARREHIRGVEETAILYAQNFGINPKKALLAARAHDMAREWPNQKLLEYCTLHSLAINDYELSKPVLLHGKVAAHLLTTDYNLADQEINFAISHHTLGHPDFGPLAKVLFIADYIEPGRKHISQEWRSTLSELSLDSILCTVICHSSQLFGELNPLTQDLYSKIQPSCKHDHQACVMLARKAAL